METSRAAPIATHPEPRLVELLDRPGPFLSVYLTTDARIDNASHHSQQRWKTMRADLEQQGAPPELLDRVEALVPDAHLAGQCLSALIAMDGTEVIEHHDEEPKADIGRWSQVPVLAPCLEWHQRAVPYVVVLADRTGADLVAVRRSGRAITAEVGDDDGVIERNAPGGWSQKRYQRRAESTWDENARDVAAEVERLAQRVDARLVVVAGDVRAKQLLREHLAGPVAELVREVEGGRGADGSSDDLDAEIRPLVATVTASDTRAVLQRFREERGRLDRAADGPAATITALNEGRVDLLLVPGDVDDPATLWCGDAPVPIAASPVELGDLGVDVSYEAPLVDVLIRAALGTAAGVRVVPRASAPEDGIGALLRW